jgi:tetratricopeptide (TPR) repeat protein
MTTLPRFLAILLFLALLCVTGCKPAPTPTPERFAAAKALFDQTAKEFHNLSAEKTGPEREKLLTQAAAGYEQLAKNYPEQTNWCAQALRSLGSVRAAQGRTNEAVRVFTQVAQKYPSQDWEVIQAWKSAADLLMESGRPQEAKEFYRQIVERFDQPNTSQVVKIIINAARKNLGK